MDVLVRVPRGMQAVSTGRLVSADSGTEDAWDTWHWVSRQPMATFLTFVAIGGFTLEQGVVDGLPYVYAVTDQLPDADQRTAFTALRTSAAKVSVLAGLFGPYPFTELGGIVPAAKVPFDGLETQTQPVHRGEAILDRGSSDSLLAHELAHMWFGDNVTVRQWNDIFDSEAYASWAAWAWRERTGGTSAQTSLTRLYDRARDADDFWRVTMIDPGRRNMFTTVYYRGPMALQALRVVMGDDAFTRLNTEWAQDPGSRSLEDWMAKAQSLTPTDLQPFFQAWIFGTTAPPRTAANGPAAPPCLSPASGMSTQHEAGDQGVARVDEERVLAGQVRGARDRRDHRGHAVDLVLLEHPGDEPRPDDRVVGEHLVVVERPGRGEGGDAGGCAGPARRTVDLTVGEHRHVALVGPSGSAEVLEQDRAVDAAEPLVACVPRGDGRRAPP